MSPEEVLLIGFHDPNRLHLPLQEIVRHHAVIRDAIAGTLHIEASDPVTCVANASLVYAFNAYKAIGLLLPELYHESGAAVLRQLWEVSLNLHWIERDPPNRVQDFYNFTVMEQRKLLQMSEDSVSLTEFDSATDRFQSKFWFRDGRGKNRKHSNFATQTIHNRAAELGDPWKTDYRLFYGLTSMHAHATPGAVLHAMFQQAYPQPELLEQSAAAMIAAFAVKVMVRNVELLARMKIIPDSSGVLKAFEAFQDTLAGVRERNEAEPEDDVSQ